jgi:uncharacterized protein YjeT (DUF2065 family)
MDWNDLFAAFALYLVLEGLLPFISPKSWQEAVALIARMPERQLRIFGFVSMCAGALLLAFVRA